MVEALQGAYLARQKLIQEFFRRTALLDNLDSDLQQRRKSTSKLLQVHLR